MPKNNKTIAILSSAFDETTWGPVAEHLRNDGYAVIIYQADKAREWRITVVDDDVFCAAIYTDTHAKDDWRKHQGTSAVRFEHGEFPMKLQQKCRQFLRACSLRFGAFDFIEDSHGKIIFLECNTNGQYAWLEEELGLPISRAIANSLERIADASH